MNDYSYHLKHFFMLTSKFIRNFATGNQNVIQI